MPKPIVIAIIPARLGSTRFPRKVLARETGHPLIQHVVESARRARVLSRVVVATDAPEVASAVAAFGGESVMTRADHPNGTSRLAQAARVLKLADHDIVVNVQGDEPEMEPAFIKAAVAALIKSKTEVATVALPFAQGEDASNPNIVKVVTSRAGLAMYFSRSLIPFVRDPQTTAPSPPLRHVGLYAYRVAFLKKYAKLTPAPPELAESLEQLRVLWHGHQIAVAICKGSAPAGIDTPELYEAFVARYRALRS
ncbi:MAG: 3-deoxy-manno-octulosonate cytidylyltransferase [Planctomycetota bacterium]